MEEDKKNIILKLANGKKSSGKPLVKKLSSAGADLNEIQEVELRLRELSAVAETSEMLAAQMLCEDKPSTKELLESLRPAGRDKKNATA